MGVRPVADFRCECEFEGAPEMEKVRIGMTDSTFFLSVARLRHILDTFHLSSGWLKDSGRLVRGYTAAPGPGEA